MPYFSSKRQVGMLSWHLNSQFHSDDTLPPIRHFTVEPGIASTNIVPSNIATKIFKQVLFFICRMTGSPFFTITAYNAATAIICAALAPLDIFPDMTEPLKLLSTVNRWGRGGMLLEITGLQELGRRILLCWRSMRDYTRCLRRFKIPFWLVESENLFFYHMACKGPKANVQLNTIHVYKAILR
ncbi:hypothetical protein JB92DRAFT_2998092 [Gautieria morchelliformis]|nr:hypothetical protein JB92DRAFT_2998092 [Gautieria morchelliformis]